MSKIKITRELKIGLFALLTILSLYFVVNYLKGKNLFSSRNSYITIYQDVAGLTPTGPVYIRGLKVGTIETISYNQEKDNFTVEIKVKSEYKIPTNSIAEAYSSDIMGTKALRINIGDAPSFLNSKDTLASTTEAGLVQMITQELFPLKEDISNLISNINTTFNSVNEILNPQAQKELAQSLENLNRTLANAKTISNSLTKGAPKINQLLSNLNDLTTKLNVGTESLNKGLDNFAEITDSLKSAELVQTISSLKDLLQQVQNPSGSIGKLLQTDSLHSSIEMLTRDLDQLVKNINNNPKKYIKISVF